MRIVLDTNVLVSGLLSPDWPPGRVVDLLLRGGIVLCFDDRVLAEYRRVLARPKFGFDPAHVREILDYLQAEGEATSAAPLNIELPDPDDRAFLEVAVAAGAEFLITGNLKHFPAALRRGADLVVPGEFLEKHWQS